MSIKTGVWKNGAREVTGTWEYYWPSDRFIIRLNSMDRVTRSNRVVVTSNDRPQWGNWKLQPDVVG